MSVRAPCLLRALLLPCRCSARLPCSPHMLAARLQLVCLTSLPMRRAVLLKRFMQQPEPLGDPFAHVASILVNLTRLRAARSLLLQPGRGLLGALGTQLHSALLLRRQGAAGTLRNVCFSAEVSHPVVM